MGMSEESPDEFPLPYESQGKDRFPGIEHIVDAKLWVHAADTYNRRIGIEQDEDEPEDPEELLDQSIKRDRLIELLRLRINAKDPFVVRLLAELERTAKQYEDPEAVRVVQFEDLYHFLSVFRD